MTVDVGDEAVRAAVTDSVTFAFADPAGELCGLARLGLAGGSEGDPTGSVLAVLFARRAPVAATARAAIPPAADAGWDELELAGLRTRVVAPLARWEVGFDAAGGDGFRLDFEATGDPAELAGADPVARLGGMAGYDQPCRVRGTVRAGGREHRVEALGQRSHAWGDPDWERIELARSVAAWTDAGPSATLSAVRPTGARHHAEEAVWAALWEAGGPLPIDEGRLSTTYDADGRMRRAGLELWPVEDGDESWVRRGAGEVMCGSSLDLGPLRLDCSFFRWHLEGRDGVGRYDILRRA